MTPLGPTTSIADYLAGYVVGYWQGYDFAVDPPEEMWEGKTGPAAGAADASSPAPGTGPASVRSAHGLLTDPDGPDPAGPAPSAASSLPAIHQPAAPLRVEIAGELERIFIHRGMVLALRAAASKMFALDLAEAEHAIWELVSTTEQSATWSTCQENES